MKDADHYAKQAEDALDDAYTKSDPGLIEYHLKSAQVYAQLAVAAANQGTVITTELISTEVSDDVYADTDGLIEAALAVDGAHRKQHYLHQLAGLLLGPVRAAELAAGYEEGIPA